MTDPIVIVGATGAVGRALAARLHDGGAGLHLIARDADRLAEIAESTGAGTAVADCLDDVALTEAVQAAAARVARLAYCVGSIVTKPLKRAQPEDFAAAFALNVTGAARAVAAAEAGLRAAQRSVVLFSFVAARSGFPNHAVIGSAKAGVEGLALALAAEPAPVRVNCIAASLTTSAMAALITGNATMARGIAGQHPLARLDDPEDQAALVAFLLSSDASWMTGQIIGVDGGRSNVRTRG